MSSNTFVMRGNVVDMAVGTATINYGVFVNDVINFLIVAMVIFWLIKPINRWKGVKAATAPSMKNCPYCLSQIPSKAVRCAQCTAELNA